MTPRKPTILVATEDPEPSQAISAWLREAGLRVIGCPRPQPPSYVCAGGRGESCPFAVGADVVVLDLWLELATDGPVPVRLPGLPARTVTAPGASWQRAGQEWKEKPRPNLGPSASRQGPPDPEAAGRSADAAAGRTGEARMGGMRPPRA